MLIGEGRAHEDQQGRPFVGAAGHLLDELLASINMTRKDVYITNVINTGRRTTRPDARRLGACRFWLDQQIEHQAQADRHPWPLLMQLAFSGVSISRIHSTREDRRYRVLSMFLPPPRLSLP